MRYADSTLDQALDVFTDVWVWAVLVTLVYVLLGMLIARKAGYSHWLGVLAVLVPVLFIAFFALMKWPALKERDDAFKLLKKNNIALPVKPKPAPKPKPEPAPPAPATEAGADPTAPGGA